MNWKLKKGGEVTLVEEEKEPEEKTLRDRTCHCFSHCTFRLWLLN